MGRLLDWHRLGVLSKRARPRRDALNLQSVSAAVSVGPYRERADPRFRMKVEVGAVIRWSFLIFSWVVGLVHFATLARVAFTASYLTLPSARSSSLL